MVINILKSKFWCLKHLKLTLHRKTEINPSYKLNRNICMFLVCIHNVSLFLCYRLVALSLCVCFTVWEPIPFATERTCMKGCNAGAPVEWEGIRCWHVVLETVLGDGLIWSWREERASWSRRRHRSPPALPPAGTVVDWMRWLQPRTVSGL